MAPFLLEKIAEAGPLLPMLPGAGRSRPRPRGTAGVGHSIPACAPQESRGVL